VAGKLTRRVRPARRLRSSLWAHDDAFVAFFARLAASGIDRSNTLFIFTVTRATTVGVKDDCMA
jgi:hypothetical protein